MKTQMLKRLFISLIMLSALASDSLLASGSLLALDNTLALGRGMLLPGSFYSLYLNSGAVAAPEIPPVPVTTAGFYRYFTAFTPGSMVPQHGHELSLPGACCFELQICKKTFGGTGIPVPAGYSIKKSHFYTREPWIYNCKHIISKPMILTQADSSPPYPIA